MTVDTLCRCAREQSAAAGKCSTAWTLVGALQRKGRKVSVVSTMFTQPPMISDNLRSQADHFIFLSLCAVSLTDTRQNICRVRPRRSPIKPRSMPAFRRRKLSENRLLAPSGPEFRPSFEDAMAKQLNNARDVDRVSNIRDSQSLFSSAKLIALPNLPRRRAEFPGLRPRPDRQPQGDCWGSRHVSSS